MATIVKTPAGTWKALVRKPAGRPTPNLSHKARCQDWARRPEDEMVSGVYIQRSGSQRMTLEMALQTLPE